MTLKILKISLALFTDAAVLSGAMWIAIVLRYGVITPPSQTIYAIYLAPIAGVITLALLGFYREIVKYLGPKTLYRCGIGITLTTLILLSASFLIPQNPTLSRISFITFWMAGLLGICGVRLLLRSILRSLNVDLSEGKRRVMIYGAGEAGAGLASVLDQDSLLNVACFIDDDPALNGREVRGIRIYPSSEVSNLITQKHITTVMLALPSVSRDRRKEVITMLKEHAVEVLTVPDLNDLEVGTASAFDVRPIDISDLLGREPVEPRAELIRKCIFERTVLVTGAGGSIGSELCHTIISHAPSTIVLVDNCEFNLYKINEELQLLNEHGAHIRPLLVDVTDKSIMHDLMQYYEVDTVYHAAAYKHVTIVESNPISGVKNNVFGTLKTAEAALCAGVKDFVLISTDKAVRPTGVMGASKRLAEIVLQSLADTHKQNKDSTKFSMVRFGNVLGSSGSAIPKFIEQIKAGGPVTVTHPDINRFFMTINEAVSLVVQAGALSKGGDVFLLDMGEPVNITDLVQNMITLSGATIKSESNPKGQIEIQFTGLQPGEKLFEELLITGVLEGTVHPKIMRSAEEFLPWEKTSDFLRQLEQAIDCRNEAEVKSILRQTVSGYKEQNQLSHSNQYLQH